MVCLVILLCFTYARDYYREATNSAKKAKIVQTVLTVLSLIDLVNTTIWLNRGTTKMWLKYPWISAALKPPIIVVLVRSLRTFWKRYLQVISRTSPMTFFILVVIMYYSWMGMLIF